MLSLGDFMWVARRKASVVLAEVRQTHFDTTVASRGPSVVLHCTVLYFSALQDSVSLDDFPHPSKWWSVFALLQRSVLNCYAF